jgi:hypothetical protein
MKARHENRHQAHPAPVMAPFFQLPDTPVRFPIFVGFKKIRIDE